MKTTVDYSQSPAASFDAVQDIKEWFGDRYDSVANELRKTKDQEQFTLWCSFGGIEGFPVKAWFEHFHGQGSWGDQSGSFTQSTGHQTLQFDARPTERSAYGRPENA